MFENHSKTVIPRHFSNVIWIFYCLKSRDTAPGSQYCSDARCSFLSFAKSYCKIIQILKILNSSANWNIDTLALTWGVEQRRTRQFRTRANHRRYMVGIASYTDCTVPEQGGRGMQVNHTSHGSRPATWIIHLPSGFVKCTHRNNSAFIVPGRLSHTVRSKNFKISMSTRLATNLFSPLIKLISDVFSFSWDLVPKNSPKIPQNSPKILAKFSQTKSNPYVRNVWTRISFFWARRVRRVRRARRARRAGGVGKAKKFKNLITLAHREHLSHPIHGYTMTWSPRETPSADGPVAYTSPTISWPTTTKDFWN